jgi:hypothetical protein
MEFSIINDTLDQHKKTQLLETEYKKLQTYCADLELTVSNANSQIKSMKLALSYSDTYSIRKETEMREEIDRLNLLIKKKTEKKKKKENDLTHEIHKKSEYIDNLMAKIQNLYQKSEYYKEDMFKYQSEYSKTKDLLEEERQHKEKIKENYLNSTQKLEELMGQFRVLNEEIEAYKVEKDKNLKDIIEKINQNSAEEIDSVRAAYESQQRKVLESHKNFIDHLQKDHSSVITALKKYTEKRLDDLRHFYESRVSSLINEISYSEAKHQAEMSHLKENLFALKKEKDSLARTNLFLKEKANEKQQENQNFQIVIKTLSDKDEENLLEKKILLLRNNHEMEGLMQKYEENKKLIADEYEKNLKLTLKHQEDEVNRISNFYKANLEKITQEAQERKTKRRKHYEIQIEFLLAQIEKLEKEKSELEIQSEQRIESLKKDSTQVITM